MNEINRSSLNLYLKYECIILSLSRQTHSIIFKSINLNFHNSLKSQEKNNGLIVQRCFKISYGLTVKQMKDIKKIIKDDIEQKNIGIVPFLRKQGLVKQLESEIFDNFNKDQEHSRFKRL